jgi:DNA-binding transcriptional ArsR family regulator
LQSFADDNDNENNDCCYHRRKPNDDNDGDTRHVYQRSKHTTPSQDAMLKHMADLQMHQGMPWVCWRDFKELNLTHGTIRNNLSKLKEMGLIEYSHKSNDAYYTLPKSSLQDAMTLDHPWVTKPELALLIKRLAFDTPAVHNIRLRFHCPTIYSRLRAETDKEIIILPRSEDLVLPREILENGAIEAGITVHRTNYVSVSLACSDHPIHFDIAGLVKLTSCLCRIEERLRSKLLSLIDIPYFGRWIVTMWHVGVDSKERYTGPTFEETWDHITGEMYHVYSKVIKKEKTRVLRLERQEYPNNPVHDAVEQILSRVLGSAGDGGVV